MNILPGIPALDIWEEVRQSASYRQMKQFSDAFIARFNPYLHQYSNKWVSDPLQQWSRIWEYPFVFGQIAAYATMSKARKHSILDAGSGITFFPYYISESLPSSSVICYDLDHHLTPVFAAINSATDREVMFSCADLQSLPCADETYDIVYCISVLEHLPKTADAVRELSRVLKKGGVLIVTLDVSLDGKSEIPPKGAEEIIALLRSSLRDTTPALTLRSMLKQERLLTTAAIAAVDAAMLPWPITAKASLIRRIWTKNASVVPKLLTVFGGSYMK